MQRLPGNELVSCLTFSRDALGMARGHGIHLSKARLFLSILNAHLALLQGRNPDLRAPNRRGVLRENRMSSLVHSRPQTALRRWNQTPTALANGELPTADQLG
jgi:hypothetical protein